MLQTWKQEKKRILCARVIVCLRVFETFSDLQITFGEFILIQVIIYDHTNRFYVK